MTDLLRQFVREESGQDLTEYALLLALIAVVCIGGVGALGNDVNAIYQNLATHFPVGS